MALVVENGIRIVCLVKGQKTLFTKVYYHLKFNYPEFGFFQIRLVGNYNTECFKRRM